VTQRSRQVGAFNLAVDALLFTSLSTATRKILLNAEIGDYGALERRDCGCLLGATGLRLHLSGIRSFEKLTGEGVSFVSSNLIRILEEVLPAQFGGSSLDYQLVEEEREQGTFRLALLASPRLGSIDEHALRAAFLAELRRDGPAEAYFAQLWKQAGSVEVRRQLPIATAAGKIMPFHLVTSRSQEVRRP
jgi:hypothetical protein